MRLTDLLGQEQGEPRAADDPAASTEVAPSPARRGRGRRSNRRRFGVLAVALIVLVLIGSIGGGVAYFVGRPWAQRLQLSLEGDLSAGASELQAGTDAVHKANQTHDLTQLDQAQFHFSASRSKFDQVQKRIAGEWVLQWAGKVPRLGSTYVTPRTNVVSQVAAMGIALSDAGHDTADVDRQLLAPGNKDLSGGQRLIGVLTTSAPALTKIQADLGRASQAAGLVNAALLPASQQTKFAKARDQVQSGIAGIAEFKRLAPVLLEVLGANGPRSYLIEQVDPAELRGGGGFIGSYSILSADHGVLKLGKTGDTGAIDAPYPIPGSKKYIAPPNSSLQFTQHGWVFGDSNFSADFPTSAKSGQALFLNETGIKVDGVISIDPAAVAALLQVTGPIPVPEYNTTAESATFAEQVFQREEKVNLIVPGKKNFFPVVADRLIEKISTLPSDGWPKLLTVLNTVVQDRHLQVYFNDATAEAEMSRINWAGATVSPTTEREIMFEVESNFGGTKANHFIERSYSLSLVAENAKLHHHLVITLTNSTPDGYLGGRTYTSYLRFYYPTTASNAVTNGLTPDRFATDEKPSDMRIADGWVDLPIRDLKLGYATYQVTIDFTTDLGDLTRGHEIYWQKQAGTASDKVHATFQSAGVTTSVDTDLSQDRILTVSYRGLQAKPGNVPTAQFPVLGS